LSREFIVIQISDSSGHSPLKKTYTIGAEASELISDAYANDEKFISHTLLLPDRVGL